MAAGSFAAVIYTLTWMLTHQLQSPDPEAPAFSAAIGIVASVAPLAVLIIAVKAKSFSLRD